MLALEGSAAIPVTAPQSSWFEPGASAAATVWGSLSSAFALGAQVRGALLADGAAPEDPTLADPGMGSLLSLGLGARLRLEAAWDASPRRATGPFIDAFGAAVLTGTVLRPSLEIGLGYGFEVGDVSVGPSVRWLTVFETESQLAPAHANTLLFGIELVLFDARPTPAPAPPVRVATSTDRCPDEPEDHDGFQDDDGCPDLDDDADGIPDAEDRCPRSPEDADGIEDEDGCPEDDADGDTIPDASDACPLEAEVVNGVDDGDGCPDRGLIELIDDRIVLDERVLFDLERARVRSRALPTLRAIVELSRQHPEWIELRIEGHADVQGTRAYNQELSERRAARVRDALVELGIPAEIITSAGYGERAPRAWGDDEAAHQRNRRVEFVVARRAARTSGGSQR